VYREFKLEEIDDMALFDFSIAFWERVCLARVDFRRFCYHLVSLNESNLSWNWWSLTLSLFIVSPFNVASKRLFSFLTPEAEVQ
jgi:hypothetical protein